MFEYNYSALESVSHGLKYVVTHFQYINFFNTFSMHFRPISYAGFLQIGSQIVRVPMTDYGHLVYLESWQILTLLELFLGPWYILLYM